MICIMQFSYLILKAGSLLISMINNLYDLILFNVNKLAKVCEGYFTPEPVLFCAGRIGLIAVVSGRK